MHAHKFLCQTRRMSTYAVQYPFPKHAHPTPHQIFHLPTDASQKEIKSRYYDLVRLHHPDSPHCRHLSPAIRHSRFQSITAAYDILRGKRAAYNPSDPVRDELERRRRATTYQRHRHHSHFADAGVYGFDLGSMEEKWDAHPDKQWKDWVIIGAGLLSLVAGIIMPMLWPVRGLSEKRHMTASANLAEAQNEAREFGAERREEIRKRVREHCEIQKFSEQGHTTSSEESTD